MFDAGALKKIIASGGVPYRQSAISYKFDCPLCGKREKVWMYKASGNFRCWSCEADGFKGAAEKALVALYGGNYEDYRRLLRGGEPETLGLLQLDFDDDDDLFVDESADFTGWEWSPMAVAADEPAFAPGRAYLLGRGIGDDIIKKYDIRYSPAEKRVLFPYVLGGELVGWQGRLIVPNVIVDSLTGKKRELPKALTTIQPGIQGNYVMFAANLDRSAHAVITEGPVSGLKTELCGGNVVSLGKGVTPSQLDFVAKRVGRVYLALDSDAGDDITRAANILLSMGTEVMLMRVPQQVIARQRALGKSADFGDCTPEEALQAFRDANCWRPGQAAISLGGELVF